MTSKVLFVDDEIKVLNSLRRCLRDQGYQVLVAQSAQEGLDILARSGCNVVVSDYQMPGVQGTDFLTLVRKLHPATVRIMLTGKATMETALKSINDGEVYRFLMKPWDAQVLKDAVSCAVAKSHDQVSHNPHGTFLHRHKERLMLERTFPGISRINRDRSGCHYLQELSDEDVADIRSNLLDDLHVLHDAL